ncbi:unnamed protein product [Orchesella dallaii]|uniref:Uncharacterized protein n=1 Tax=Orchesella dallaii TaxID=48710 RepID=A0ABP1S7K4_9HEXA
MDLDKVLSNQSEELLWWKKVVGFLLASSQVDQRVIARTATVLLILVGKTLQITCAHFVRNAQGLHNISRNEIILRFFRIRKAFSLANTSFESLLLIVVTVENVNICMNLVYAFNNNQPSYFGRLSTLATTTGFLYFLLLAAKSSNQGGFQRASEKMWYTFIEMDPEKATSVTNSGKLAWWKLTVGFLLAWSLVNQYMISGATTVLFILIAKTLQLTTTHFKSSIRDAQNFCFVSNEQVYLYSAFPCRDSNRV